LRNFARILGVNMVLKCISFSFGLSEYLVS
jgi:hypothetical protein